MSKATRSRQWLNQHKRDPYVRLAQSKGYRSRAAFKLLEINARDRLLYPKMTVVDLGAAPGGWSQVAAQIVGSQGRVVASDIAPMNPLTNVTFIQGDFTEPGFLPRLAEELGGSKADLVISDMAPNITGIRAADQALALELVTQALEFGRITLKPKGSLLVKLFTGEGTDAFLEAMRGSYRVVYTRKPKSSRSRSREIYALGRFHRKVD